MRLWQTRFQVVRAFPSLPVPHDIVYERQTGPEYHIEESVRRQSPPVAQIVCTIRGEGAFRYRDKVHALTPGVTFLECIGDPDAAYYYPGHASGPWEFLWISFAGETAVEAVREMNRRYGYVFKLPLETGLIPQLKSFQSQRDIFQVISPTAGAKIVMDALAAFGETVEHDLSSSSQAKLTQAAQQLIAANLDRSLDVAKIAERLHVTREHLTRVFRSQTGMSPGQFASGERMRIAARLIMSRSVSVKEIAVRLGYDSASSFARAFRARFGVNPAKFNARTPQENDGAGSENTVDSQN